MREDDSPSKATDLSQAVMKQSLTVGSAWAQSEIHAVNLDILSCLYSQKEGSHSPDKLQVFVVGLDRLVELYNRNIKSSSKDA